MDIDGAAQKWMLTASSCVDRDFFSWWHHTWKADTEDDALVLFGRQKDRITRAGRRIWQAHLYDPENNATCLVPLDETYRPLIYPDRTQEAVDRLMEVWD